MTTTELRPDLALIADLIAPGSRVLDLGCGDGRLLTHLTAERGCRGTGVEIEEQAVIAALRSGVNVIELDIDHELTEFGDDSYDVVVLSRTLQTLRRPGAALREMARIAQFSVVSMPNFGLWRNRVRLAHGRMPMSRDLPFDWHDTPNLHHATLRDLEPIFALAGLRVVRRLPLNEAGGVHRWGQWNANLIASSAIYLLRSS